MTYQYRRAAAVLAAGMGLFAGTAGAQARTFTTVQRGATITTEKYTVTADTVVSTAEIGGVSVKSRLQIHAPAGGIFDAEATVNTTAQHIHIELAEAVAKVHYDGPGFTLDTVIDVPREMPVVIYYNLVFSTLQPIAALRPKPGASRPVALIVSQSARIETWTLQSLAADSVQVRTPAGLQLLLTFSGDTLVGVDVPAQQLTARSALLAAGAPTPGKGVRL